MKEKQFVYDTLMIDLEDRTFTILDGSIGTYYLEEVEKCSIVYENEKYKKEKDVLVNAVSITNNTHKKSLFEKYYIGIKIYLRNKDVIGVYMTKNAIKMNESDYTRIISEAQGIKKILDTKGNHVDLSTSRKLKKARDTHSRFDVLHKDLKQYWFGKYVFYVLAIVFAIVLLFV